MAQISMIKDQANPIITSWSYMPLIVTSAQYDGPSIPIEPTFREGVDAVVSIAIIATSTGIIFVACEFLQRLVDSKRVPTAQLENVEVEVALFQGQIRPQV